METGGGLQWRPRTVAAAETLAADGMREVAAKNRKTPEIQLIPRWEKLLANRKNGRRKKK